MKKIDLHIHTVSTFSDSAFELSLDTFKGYVKAAHLDAVAVTNHDVFDAGQFSLIHRALSIAVFPGIEINVDHGHVLVIGDACELDDFSAKSALVSKRITRMGDRLSVGELREIYGDLSRYLVIPHSDKAPPVMGETLRSLMPYICAGEVDSAKKFTRAIKDESKLPPVLFSDSRMKAGLSTFSSRQTFVDRGAPTLRALKECLRDKSKIALSENDGNKLWQVFESGQKLSTGLNVLMGSRSSGKTHTLGAISKSVESAKYIKQFSLVQQDEVTYEREFTSNVERKRSVLADEHLVGFKRVLDEMMDVDLIANDRHVSRYLETLLKSADESDRSDAFSKAALFHEEEFSIGKTNALMQLIESVRHVIENVEYRGVIEKHVAIRDLKALACELITALRARTLEFATKRQVNALVREIKKNLGVRTAATQVEDVDLYEIAMDARRVERFTAIVESLKRRSVILEETIQGFRVEAIREPYDGAGEIKTASGVKTAFSEAFRKYNAPYQYLQELLKNEALAHADLYKLFVKISYHVLNADGFAVSGGERSEFRLLQEIADAQNYDILLIDEPESSFDNLFLKSDVNQILRDISETMPVVVVTHNSTVGASVGADFILYARKEIESDSIVYRIYSGYPTDKVLHSEDGKAISTHEVMMDSLEAGVGAYESRRRGYEAVKD